MFKVVREIESRYYSFNLTKYNIHDIKYNAYDDTFIREYKLHHKTEPIHGKLFAFQSLADVKHYLHNEIIDATVFKCEIEISNLNKKELEKLEKDPNKKGWFGLF